MCDTYLDQKQLNSLLQQRLLQRNAYSKENNGIILQRIGEVEDHLCAIFHNTLNYPKWALEHFLSLIAGVTFRTYVTSKMKSRHIITLQDIRKSIIDAIKELSLRIKFFKNKSEIVETTPIGCLELLINHNLEIPKYFEKVIRCSYYNLDEKLATHGKPRPITYDLKQAAIFINEHLETNFREQNIVELCMQYEFGAYVDNNIFLSVEKFEQKMRSRAEVEKARALTVIDEQFKYNYEGLVRLIKNGLYTWDEEEDELLLGQTLKYIRDGGAIELKNTLILLVQPSFSEYVFGGKDFRKPSSYEAYILPGNLRFIQEELLDFIEKYKEKKHVATTHLIKNNEVRDAFEPSKTGFDRSCFHPMNMLDILYVTVKEIDSKARTEPLITLVLRAFDRYLKNGEYKSILQGSSKNPSIYYSDSVRGGQWTKSTISKRITKMKNYKFVGRQP